MGGIDKFFSNPNGIYRKVNWLMGKVKQLSSQQTGVPTLQEVVDKGDEADEITLEQLVLKQSGSFSDPEIALKTYGNGYLSIYTKFDNKQFYYHHHSFAYVDDDAHSASFITSNLTGSKSYYLPDNSGTILLKPQETEFQHLDTNAEKGEMRYLIDAANISYRGIASGGGTDFALVIYDGNNWIYH